MRMWMVNPEYMCKAHLRKEHYSVHSIFRRMQQGRALNDIVAEPMSITTRHNELAKEMKKRGMRHESPMPKIHTENIEVIWGTGSLAELCASCSKCRERILSHAKGMDTEVSGT